MADLKKSLSKIAVDLMKVAKKAEALAEKLDSQGKPKQAATKTAPKKTANKAAKQPTAADTVYKVIARYKKGADVERIKQKTGYDTKKIHSLVYRLKKQAKIKSERKGVYMKA